MTGYRSQEHQIKLSVYAFLIEHPQGLILVDTGWHSDMRYDQYEILGDLHYKAGKALLPKGQAIDEQLSAMGIKPKDLDYVLITHLHTDHVSGLKLVADAKKILVSQRELADAEGPLAKGYKRSMWESVNLETFILKDTGYGPHGHSYDLLGDESVVIVGVAGHTNGMCAVQIKNDGKFVLLTGDSAYAKKSWEEMLLPGNMADAT